MPKKLNPVPPPEFLVPKNLLSMRFVQANAERRRDGIQISNVVETSNLSLLMKRYIPHQVIRNEDEDRIIELRFNRGKQIEEEKTYLTLRNLWFEHLPNNFTNQNEEFASIINAVHQRWMTITTKAPVRFTMPAATRLIVGLGGKGALEIGITLQFLTGLPIIPGSALKGLARAYGLLTIAAELPSEKPDELDEALGKGEFKAITNPALLPMAKHFQRAFGSQDAGGVCVFHDSVVAELPGGSLFEVDVMTPHFSEYYGDKTKSKCPSDDQSPIPITFLTVAPGTTFAFAVGLRRGAGAEDDQTAQQAAAWLTAGLQELGIGSKTSAGYGAFGARRDL